jgi:hypothetical protein
VAVVFSRGRADGFLVSRALGEEWYVKKFSTGELISLLIAFRAGVVRILLNPSLSSFRLRIPWRPR